MAKLPIKLKAELDRIQGEQIPHFALIIARMKNDCPYLPEWFTDKPVEYYEGSLQQCYEAICSMLHAYNCYNGFQFKTEYNDIFKVRFEYQLYHF